MYVCKWLSLRYKVKVLSHVQKKSLTFTYSRAAANLSSESYQNSQNVLLDEQNLFEANISFPSRKERVSVVKSYTYDDGCEPCGTDTFNREPYVVMFSSKYSGMFLLVYAEVHSHWDCTSTCICTIFAFSAWSISMPH